MTATWTPEQLQWIDGSDELEIASRRADGPGELRSHVDEAYRAKYARYGRGSVQPVQAG